MDYQVLEELIVNDCYSQLFIVFSTQFFTDNARNYFTQC